MPDVIGTTGNDILNGGAERDEIIGLEGDDLIFAGGGDDRIYAGLGNNYIDGGDGNDYLNYFSRLTAFGISPDTGAWMLASPTLTVTFTNSTVFIAENNRTDTFFNIELIQFTQYELGTLSVVLDGSAVTNPALALNLGGTDGNDILTGGAGNDLLQGGGGNDIINAGAGDEFRFQFYRQQYPRWR